LRAAAQAAPFAVVDADTGVLAGSMGIHDIDWRSRTGEVGYWVRKEMRGLGIATRALRLVSTYAFSELGLMRIILLADVRNEPSQAVARKAGYMQEGVLRSARELKGARADMALYSLLPTDAR
jgi:RimJ/RimL family protein N-acetyltransferase